MASDSVTDSSMPRRDSDPATATASATDTARSDPPVDDRPRQHKRTRAAMDPGTPKGEEGEIAKGLTSSQTPVAKQRRVEDDDASATREPGSEPTTPPSETIPTRDAPATEGKETKHIRERVAKMQAAAETADVAAAPVGTSPGTVDPSSPQPSRPAQADPSPVVQEDAQTDTAAETATPAAKSTSFVPYTGGSRKSNSNPAPSSFSAFASASASPFAAVSTTTPAKPAPAPAPAPAPTVVVVDSQKPKAKSSFSASPFLASSIPLAKQPELASSTSSPPPPPPPPSTSTSGAPEAATTHLTAPSTPQAPSSSSSSSKPRGLGANSPFSAFASTSGFASSSSFSTTKSNSTTSGGAGTFGTPSSSSSSGRGGGGAFSAFSSYSAAPSAFASVPSTPSGKSPLPRTSSEPFGDRDGAASDSPAGAAGRGATTTPTTRGVGDGTSEERDALGSSGGAGGGGSSAGARKIGEPEIPDENRRVYTERETHTGEELDEVVHSVRAKLFAMHDGNWVERGTGPLKLNKTKRLEGDKDGARIVMRADATHRLLLNSPLFKEFFIEVSNEKYVRFTLIEGGSEPISYMARLGNPAAAEALVTAVRERTSNL